MAYVIQKAKMNQYLLIIARHRPQKFEHVRVCEGSDKKVKGEEEDTLSDCIYFIYESNL